MSDLSLEESDPCWQPVDYLQYLRELHQVWAEIADGLEWRANTKGGENWRHHLPQILDTIQSYSELLRDEIDGYGEWREDGLQIEERIELITCDLVELVYWICRMIGVTPPDV
jgi:hypothetical protein